MLKNISKIRLKIGGIPVLIFGRFCTVLRLIQALLINKNAA
ncbi:hypothetical protein GMES_1709 [Paraglaciecola mesophila KMM 241]|uniref:Uncharacterized protein n=1 Tax=Paraglaciecola mesophila KMM 241 TaxID=1128912 RepID=K6ZKX3_9ALTE|nr:hypothetical protein GMES_1709 [Paraglaciecola mesophila KMM 241]